MIHMYKAWNAAMATTSPTAAQATVNGTKTYLQLATPSTRMIELISWGFSVGGSAALTGATGEVELLQTDVAATVTAHVAAGVQPQDPNVPASLLTLGTSATGYNASVEGSITATRLLDGQMLEGVAGENNFVYAYQWMPDERPRLPVSKFLRVRGTFGDTTHSFLTWVCWAE